MPVVGKGDGADRASNDADVSIVPPKIPYGGFSPVRLQGRLIGRGLPVWRLDCVTWFASVLRVVCRLNTPRSGSRFVALSATPPCERFDRPTPGALAPVRVIVSRSIITYSAPSALLADTPQFPRRAGYMRRLRCAGWCRPRPPASSSELSLPFLLSMSPSPPPESPPTARTSLRRRGSPSSIALWTRHSQRPTLIRFPWNPLSGSPGSLIRYDLLSCLPPWRT